MGLVGSGGFDGFWRVLVGSGGFWWVLVDSGGFWWVLVVLVGSGGSGSVFFRMPLLKSIFELVFLECPC